MHRPGARASRASRERRNRGAVSASSSPSLWPLPAEARLARRDDVRTPREHNRAIVPDPFPLLGVSELFPFGESIAEPGNAFPRPDPRVGLTEERQVIFGRSRDLRA